MPKIKISCQPKYSASEAFDRVKNFLENDDELRKLDPKYECEFDHSSLSGKATGKYFKASMVIQSKGESSKMDITIELPLTLALAKSIVQKKLQYKLDQVLQS